MYERTADNRVLLKRSKRPVAVNQGEQLSLFDLDILA
jgi:hypothetical protein